MGGGISHVQVNSVYDVFQLNVKIIQDAVKMYTLILYLKLYSHSILSGTLPV